MAASLFGGLIGLAACGTFTYIPGSWGSLTGSGASDSSAYTTEADADGIAPRLTLTSPASGDSYTLGGTYTFSVRWTPASGDTPPSSAVITFHKQGTLTADGNGVAKILDGSTELLEMDSSNNLIAGATQLISDITCTVSLSLQSDGTYLGTGSFTTNTLSTTYNSSNSTVTSVRESFTVSDMVAGS
ncbi:MAG TPA: hypothetical protein VHE55_15855 [Fimbriimonadaceae bacterium]|nr:hypothetical protein [Fimbriimonadaceae bacterium]